MESKLAASEKLTQLQELVAANAELLARFAEAFNSFKTEDPRLALVSPEEAGFLFPDILPIINTDISLHQSALSIITRCFLIYFSATGTHVGLRSLSFSKNSTISGGLM
jgi:hypothetical protein